MDQDGLFEGGETSEDSRYEKLSQAEVVGGTPWDGGKRVLKRAAVRQKKNVARETKRARV